MQKKGRALNYIFLRQMQENIKTRTPAPKPVIADRINIVSTTTAVLSSYPFHLPHCGRHVPLLKKNGSLQVIGVELSG